MEFTNLAGLINGMRVIHLPYLPHVFGTYPACSIETREEFDYLYKAHMLHDSLNNILYVSSEIIDLIKKECPQWPNNGSNI